MGLKKRGACQTAAPLLCRNGLAIHSRIGPSLYAKATYIFLINARMRGAHMAIQYKINVPLHSREVSDVFKSSGIKRPVDDMDRIQRMIDHADVNVSAWDGDILVGIARAITDYSYCCYLSDLAVSKPYQRRGIGTELINQLREHLGEEVSLLLLSAPTAMEYYPKVGFEKTEKAFLIPRVK